VIMARVEWQLLFVDDDTCVGRQVKEYLDGQVVGNSDDVLRVQTISDFDSALSEMEARRIDLLILDVRLGPHDQDQLQGGMTKDVANIAEEAGIRIIEAVRVRRFVPVVFYTGLDYKVRDMKSPVVWVVEKTRGLEELLRTIREVFDTALLQTNRALVQHLENVQRDYMWDFVAEHWNSFAEGADRRELAYLLAKRLAVSLSGSGIQQLAQNMGDTTGEFTSGERVHPMYCYLLPPVESTPLAGDLYHGTIGGEVGYWILITPSCDMVSGREKADFMLFSRCLPLAEQSEFRDWKANLPEPSKAISGKLKSLLRNNRQGGQSERFYFLPGALTLPDLVADFQRLVALPRNESTDLERKASLDSPFAEAFLARFSRYFGRLGTPDLDVDSVISRLNH